MKSKMFAAAVIHFVFTISFFFMQTTTFAQENDETLSGTKESTKLLIGASIFPVGKDDFSFSFTLIEEIKKGASLVIDGGYYRVYEKLSVIQVKCAIGPCLPRVKGGFAVNIVPLYLGMRFAGFTEKDLKYPYSFFLGLGAGIARANALKSGERHFSWGSTAYAELGSEISVSKFMAIEASIRANGFNFAKSVADTKSIGTQYFSLGIILKNFR